MKLSNIVYILLMSFMLFSCKQQQDLSYMIDIEDIAIETSIKNSVTTIQPLDNLEIQIAAKDMDVVAPFNQVYSSNLGNSPMQGSQRDSRDYLVDSNGNITMPILGSISTTGLTNEELRNKLIDLLSTYIKDPSVTVRNKNFKITILGEVARPGTFAVPDGAITLPSALGLAGDLTIYGERENVLIVRNENGQISKQRINLSSADYINSPYFYLKQNDLIYVSSNETRQKVSRLDPNVGIYISVASVVLGIMALLIR